MTTVWYTGKRYSASEIFTLAFASIANKEDAGFAIALSFTHRSSSNVWFCIFIRYIDFGDMSSTLSMNSLHFCYYVFRIYEVATIRTCLALKTALGSPGLQQPVAPLSKLSCLLRGYTTVWSLHLLAPLDKAIAILLSLPSDAFPRW